jgi:uncharacterized protein YbjT (DUF2867 family)
MVSSLSAFEQENAPQGGAVARALLSRGHRVKALTRKPDSDAARKLRSAGTDLVTGDFGDANKKTGIPHFDSKYLVEKHVAGLGIPYTISAPVAFMENIVAPWSIGARK